MRAPNAPAWLTDRPIAHRGLHDASRGVIENTLGAAEAAIEAGFAIECDVQMSADGEVFVFHDDSLDRLTDATGLLIERSAAEIRSARILRTDAESAPSPLVREGSGGGSRGPSETGLAPLALAGPGPGPTRHPNPPPQGGRGPVGDRIPTFAELLALVAGRTPIVCELKSRFDRDFRLGDRIAPLAASYGGALAMKSFDADLVAYLRLRWPDLGPAGRPCPVGIVAEASYDSPDWEFLTAEQKQRFADWQELMCALPDFVSFNVDDLPHRTPFFMKEFYGLPVMTWTVRTATQREAARKWADQIVFEGEGRP